MVKSLLFQIAQLLHLEEWFNVAHAENKWKQFPTEIVKKTRSIARPKKVVSSPPPVQQKIQKTKKAKKIATKKTREISLYSPEYLAKKHGININETQPKEKVSKKEKGKVSFGFYNSLIVFVFSDSFITYFIFFTRIYSNKIPFSEFYLNYFF